MHNQWFGSVGDVFVGCKEEWFADVNGDSGAKGDIWEIEIEIGGDWGCERVDGDGE